MKHAASLYAAIHRASLQGLLPEKPFEITRDDGITRVKLTGRIAVVASRGIDRAMVEFIRWHLMGRPVESFADIDEARALVQATQT